VLVEIFTSVVRDILRMAGGSLPHAELVEEVALELEGSALADAPRERVAEVVGEVAAGGPVMAVGGDVVDLTIVAEHVGFTHRITQEERESDRLELDADLGLIARIAEADGGLHLADATPLRLTVHRDPAGGLGGTQLRSQRLQGPAGWLAPFAAGSIVVVSSAEGILHLRPLADHEPVPTPEAAADLGARHRAELHAAADLANDGDGSPVGVSDLQAAGLVEGWFEPGPDRPPFGELLEPAGFQRSGDLAGTPPQWTSYASLAESVGVLARHVDHLQQPETSTLGEVLRAFRSWQGDRATAPTPSVLAPLHRMPEAALCLEEELVRADPTGVDLAAFLDAFERPGATAAAVLDTLRALAADLTGRSDDAEALLDDARRASPDWFPATEARAHLHEVRGETQEAVNLLQTTRTSADAELQILRLRNKLSSPAAGRNDPCPCGSGRKYKQCHLGQTLLPPEVQVSWLLDKARAHLHRFGPFTVSDHLPARTDRHADAEVMAADNALFAQGCLQGFLDARRAMLPPDEVALCEAWVAGNRPGLYRVVGGDYGDRSSDRADGETVVLVDVATDEPFQVQGTSLFDGSGLADVVWCRLLPDGERWWTSGFARGVEPDELGILAAATDADPADLHRALLGMPVSIRVDASDGTPQVSASSSWAVGTDRAAAESVLDGVAERHAEHWSIADDHGVGLRMILSEPIDPSLLSPTMADDPEADMLRQFSLVVRTDSLPRHARALELVAAWFPEAELSHDHATPLARRRFEAQDDELLSALYSTDLDDA
jgi:hypothetical protein